MDEPVFNVQVTKAEPLESIRFIIDDFIEKRLTFCVDGSGDKWVIWREALITDSSQIIRRSGYPKRPKIVFIRGKQVSDIGPDEIIALLAAQQPG
ncbi:MAG: hypothetical protein JXA60_00025 [Candidatus Coatesbacteria bacterium]|nr:hypothetical protein [Candidatus Coatesbacteria bacterium]